MVRIHSLLALAGVAAAIQNATVQGVYMVELRDGVTPEQLTQALSSANITVRIRQTLSSRLFSGVSLDVVGANVDAKAIRAAAGVAQVWPVRAVSTPPREVQAFVSLDEASLRRRADEPYSPHVMTQLDRLHQAGVTGRGMRIGVIDTGVDYTHPFLGGCLGPGCIVTHGWDSVGLAELLGAEGYRVPVPDDDPMDCNGHGTHVAGIISARPNAFGFTGAAPDARLGAYRAVDCLGFGTEETIAAGMLRAFDDGNDVLTMSIGVPGGIPDSFVSLVASRIVAAGVPVFVAVGNTGERSTMFDAVAPADARLVSAVASFDTVREPSVYALAEYSVDGGAAQEFGWVPLLTGRYEFAGGADNATFPLLDLNSFVADGAPVTACQKLPDSVPDLSGYLVLVERTPQNGCLFRNQRENIKAKGGSYMMFWAADDVIRAILNDDPKTFMATTTPEPAKQWRAALAAGSNVTVTMTRPIKSKPRVVWATNNKTGGQVSSYSTWGPTMDLRSAPSFGGPGRSIMSTYLQNGQGVATISGTSMSTPLVAAAAALLLQARGRLDPVTLQALLASTAAQPAPHAPLQAGAGLIQVWDAVHAKGVLSAPSVSFNDSDHRPGEVTLTLRNTGDTDAVYELDHAAAKTIYAMGQDGALARVPLSTVDAPAAIAFAADQVSVPAGGQAEITVRCTAPQGVDGRLWPIFSGSIKLNGTNGDVLSVPYIGNAGSMGEGRIFSAQDVFLVPHLSAEQVLSLPRPGGAPDPAVDGLTVTVIPKLPTRVLRYDVVVPGANGSAPANATQWLGRSTYGQVRGSPQAVFARTRASVVKFSGFLDRGSLAEGRYAILISALRLFAEPDSQSADDWQAIETVPFVLRYT